MGSTNSRYIDQFSIRVRHNNLDVYYLSQSYFNLPEKTIRINSNKILLLNQTIKDIENIYREIGGYDTSYEDFKQLCSKSWEKEYSYLCFARSKKRDQGRYCNCKESKNTDILNVLYKRHFFDFMVAKCCLHSIKNRENSEIINKLFSLPSQVKTLRSQDKLGKQNNHEDKKKVFEPVTKSIEDVFQGVTRNITETSIENNKTLESLNSKLLEIMIERGITASCLMSVLSKISNPQHASQVKLMKDPSSNKVNHSLINKTIPVALHNNILKIRVTDKELELQGDLLKKITNKNYKVDLANSPDKKLMYDFAKEMYFDEKALGNESAWDKSPIRLLKSPANMARFLKESKTRFLYSNPNELFDRVKLLLQWKQAGKNSNMFNEEIVVIADELLENKCISTKQHKILLFKCLKLIENYEVDRKILKRNYIRFSPAEVFTINTPNSRICINIPREDSVFSLLNIYLDLSIEVIKNLITTDMVIVMIKGYLI